MKENLQHKKEVLANYKKALVVIDMVNGFINEGTLADKNMRRIIEENVRLVREFLKEEQYVIFIKDTHEINSAEFKSFPPHCLRGTNEARLIEELEIFEGKKNTIAIEKNSTSAMMVPQFRQLIDDMINLEQIVGIGVCGDICVPNTFIPLKNYLNQNNRCVDLIVCENAVDTFNSINHNRDEYLEMAFKLMNQSGIQMVKKYK